MNSSPVNPHSSLELAAIYSRVSTDHQDDSLALQEQRVLAYARFKLLNTPAGLTFSDPDTSGGTPFLERTGGRALVNRLKHGDIKHLIVAKLDRLGRNVPDGLKLLDFLKEQDVILHIVDLGGESISTQGHFGRFIFTLLLAVAEWERTEIVDRTQKQMTAKFDKMELTGNVPYGYDCEYQFTLGGVLSSATALSIAELMPHVAEHGPVLGKRLVPNLDEQKIIHLMHAYRRQPGNGRKDTSYTRVAYMLNADGHTTKQGHPWTCGAVASVLNSRHTKRLLNGGAETPSSPQLKTS